MNKVNSNLNWFDLIFMDIVMPRLDGVSATAMIRDVAPRIPIIAMTSNINQQDLEMYFHWGKSPAHSSTCCTGVVTDMT